MRHERLYGLAGPGGVDGEGKPSGAGSAFGSLEPKGLGTDVPLDGVVGIAPGAGRLTAGGIAGM